MYSVLPTTCMVEHFCDLHVKGSYKPPTSLHQPLEQPAMSHLKTAAAKSPEILKPNNP